MILLQQVAIEIDQCTQCHNLVLACQLVFGVHHLECVCVETFKFRHSFMTSNVVMYSIFILADHWCVIDSQDRVCDRQRLVLEEADCSIHDALRCLVKNRCVCVCVCACNTSLIQDVPIVHTNS